MADIVDVGANLSFGQPLGLRPRIERFPQEGGVAPALVPLFEWNGVDLTQFAISPAFETAGWATTLTVVADADAPKGNLIRMGSPVGLGTGACYWLALEPLPLFENFRRYTFEYLVHHQNSNYGGVCFCADISGGPGTLHAIAAVDGQTGWQSRVDNGTLVSVGATIGGSFNTLGAQFARCRLFTALSKPVGAAPRGDVYGESGFNGSSSKGWGLGQPGWPAAPASWNPLVCADWGLVIQAGGASSAPNQFDIADIRVFAEE